MLDIPYDRMTYGVVLSHVGVQRAVLGDTPGALYGDYYEWCFAPGLIDGAWK